MNPGSFATRMYAGGALAAALVALAASLLAATAMWLALPLAIAVYLGVRAYRSGIEAERGRAQHMSELHLATIEALALAIDAKDHAKPNHIHHMQAYATGLARALGMSESEVQAVKTASLL